MPLRLSPSSLYAIQPVKTLGSVPSISPFLRTLPHRPLFPKNPVRLASQRGPRRTQYNRFGNAQSLYGLWRTNPNFRYGIGALGLGGGAFYYYNLEEVPISGRRRFNCISPAREAEMTGSQYQMIMQQYGRDILPPDHPHSKMVNRVLRRLVPAAGLEEEKWEVKVINDPDQQNAFVLPGGKVFVFSGILPICAGDDGLAAVLGHEIAHNVAHHISEKMSQMVYVLLFRLILLWTLDLSGDLSQLLLDFALERPNSRKMESEADYIGLLMMAQACYDPSAAVGLWERMAEAEKFAVPQILSTHPASRKRMTVIQEWLPQAHQKRAESRCGITSGYMDDFATAFGHGDEGFW